MRGKTKIVKSVSLLAIIASLFLATMLTLPSFAAVTTLTAPKILDVTKGIGSTLSVDIEMTDALDVWGYQFTLRYDTSVLTATGNISHPMFGLMEPGEINEAEGYISIAYHMPFGAPVGFTGPTMPFPGYLARIEFTVDALGASQLNIEDSVLSDPLGNAITHMAVNGWFRNVVGVPMADFNWAPETPIQKELVTFTSTSTDPDGSIVSWTWDFGDSSGSGDTVTHKYMQKGTYTVTLTVMDNDGKTDSFAQTITVLRKPPKRVGVKINTAATDQHLLNFSEGGVVISRFRAQIKNLNPIDDTYTRVAFFIYAAGAPTPLGIIEPPWVWLKKGQGKQFTADFDYTEWGFTGPSMQFLVVVHTYWMDYEISPGQPHWVELTAQKSFSFWVYELAPVLVYSWADLGGNTVSFDASASYDPDEALGDSIVSYMWRVYDVWPYSTIMGATTTHTLPAAGTYDARIYITDSLGATVIEDFEITVTT